MLAAEGEITIPMIPPTDGEDGDASEVELDRDAEEEGNIMLRILAEGTIIARPTLDVTTTFEGAAVARRTTPLDAPAGRDDAGGLVRVRAREAALRVGGPLLVVGLEDEEALRRDNTAVGRPDNCCCSRCRCRGCCGCDREAGVAARAAKREVEREEDDNEDDDGNPVIAANTRRAEELVVANTWPTRPNILLMLNCCMGVGRPTILYSSSSPPSLSKSSSS
mmetsp:Transcript_1687/g.2604  ORF Transcript_1687/g.2604 Transcript_1687/m.2604 type:complete len:222 (-) Transcript_1687:838-1503(-)